MKLREFINIAKHSELSSLAVKDNEAAVTQFVNLGLVELYTLFTIMTEEHVIFLNENQYIYEMPDDFLFLTGAFELQDGKVVPVAVNEEYNPMSINTIGPRSIQIPINTNNSVISLTYASRPPVFTEDDMDKEIPLPPQMLQALFAFVAYKAHGAIRLGENTDSDAYFARFRSACRTLEQRGTGVAADDLEMPFRIHDRGFV